MRLVTALVTLAIAGCGASATPSATPDAAPVGEPATGQAQAPLAAAGKPVLSGARKQLQGNWEIVRYQSDRPIDKAAMPLMGELFDVLRLRFDGASVVAKAGTAPEERASFDVAEESGDAFRLVVKGGMFDGARCRFLAEDQWEVTDKGPTWPGVSILKRTR
jgi:hypothetical protein